MCVWPPVMCDSNVKRCLEQSPANEGQRWLVGVLLVRASHKYTYQALFIYKWVQTVVIIMNKWYSLLTLREEGGALLTAFHPHHVGRRRVLLADKWTYAGCISSFCWGVCVWVTVHKHNVKMREVDRGWRVSDITKRHAALLHMLGDTENEQTHVIPSIKANIRVLSARCIRSGVLPRSAGSTSPV